MKLLITITLVVGAFLYVTLYTTTIVLNQTQALSNVYAQASQTADHIGTSK